ncbi:TPA: RyR domain-containing protein [Burkholderia contaminans]|uniref:RyR domain-containing protein n=1 Tax=Burkholderia contaminans TaxID=488447 RepID=UPI000D00B308|nr:RyR domain-containing protein [Burkholderia contaminans]HDR9065511.1 hypothetical protein [Burkholderia vietnamiensis]MBM6427950.1 hypothetical protein [Burkholderia contaminans]MCA7876781.1 hypothetical protein [Burkholderia contaminans]MDN8024196.1 RyR domain-containing protein [Burkholderia contaminans]PRG12195.1 hypothetical protein C6Q17_14145 [Burkholderia contaminans]
MHEVERAYRKSVGEADAPSWEKASPQAREGAIFSVRALAGGCVTPESIHAQWVSEMSRLGWTRGDAVDYEAKTHPNLTEYAALPREIQTRDALMVAVVRGALCVREPEDEEAAEAA